jgi:hypothetical protein
MKRFALSILFVLIAAPAWAATYYLAPASGGGNDSNSGTSAGSPWLTPNHPVNCGDVILAAASTAYSQTNFTYGKWGAVACPAGNNVAWLKCVTFDACKMAISSADGFDVDNSYWGIQGFEVDGTSATGPCFNVYPSKAINIHHVILANNIASGCGLNGFDSGSSGSSGVDYFDVIGNIAQNTAGGSAYCGSGISVYEPVASDSLPGTHIYIGGNFSWANVDGNPCAGGAPTDGEGINLDTFDGNQTGTPMYSQQVVVDNNILVANGGPGLEAFNNASGTASFSNIFFRHNTVWGNNTDTNALVAGYAVGQVLIYQAQNVQVFQNIAVTNAAVGARSNPVYAYWVSTSNGTTHVYQNVGYSPSGTVNGIYNSTGFSYDPSDLFTTNPSFANATIPGVPSCGTFASVTACMATVIANFTPTAAAAKAFGYQLPSTSQAYDPLFPQWLCNVNLPAGLVTMGCFSAPLAPAAPTITRVTIN